MARGRGAAFNHCLRVGGRGVGGERVAWASVCVYVFMFMRFACHCVFGCMCACVCDRLFVKICMSLHIRVCKLFV